MTGLMTQTESVRTDPSVKILLGTALDRLRDLPDESVHCVVTSPPYYGLRDYKIEHSVWAPAVYSPMAGLPELSVPEHGNPEAFSSCDHEWGERKTYSTVRESTKYGKGRTTARFYGDDPTRRFDGNHQKHFDGSFCVRCGAWKGCLGNEPTPELFVGHLVQVFREVRRVLRSDGTLWLNFGDSYTARGGRRKTHYDRLIPGRSSIDIRQQIPEGLKEKEIIGVPWRVALALQSDGWFLRQDIIWSKRNPMPGSYKDRCTSAHEYIFLLAKSRRYFFDYEALSEPAVSTGARTSFSRKTGKVGMPWKNSQHRLERTYIEYSKKRNIRSVWSFSTCPFPEAHFAVFPPELPKKVLMAGMPKGGVCAECGAPFILTEGLWKSSCGHSEISGGGG